MHGLKTKQIKAFDKAIIKYSWTYLKTTEMKQFRIWYEAADTNVNFKGFAYSLLLNLKNYFIHLLRGHLIQMAVTKFNKSRQQQDVTHVTNTEQRRYIAYSMGGSVCHSLLRNLYNNHYEGSKNKYMLAIVKHMLLNNKESGNEDLANIIPHRLYLENRGGLRIIKEKFVPIIQAVINEVSNNFDNMISKTKGNLCIIFDEIMKRVIQSQFERLFDYRAVVKSMAGGDQEFEFEFSREDDDEFSNYLQNVYEVLMRKLVNRCLWSRIKRIKEPNIHRIELRKRLLVNYLTTKQKHSSLQANSSR